MSRKALILMGLGIMAFAMYAAGMTTASMLVFAGAFVVEIIFWVKVYRSNKKAVNDESSN